MTVPVWRWRCSQRVGTLNVAYCVTAARAPPVAARISAYNELVTSHLGECQLPFQVPESRIPIRDACSERDKSH